MNHTSRFSNSGLFTRDRESRSIHEQSAPLNFIQPGQLRTVIVHAEMTLKESKGRTVLRALREESITAVTVEVTRTPQLTSHRKHFLGTLTGTLEDNWLGYEN